MNASFFVTKGLSQLYSLCVLVHSVETHKVISHKIQISKYYLVQSTTLTLATITYRYKGEAFVLEKLSYMTALTLPLNLITKTHSYEVERVDAWVVHRCLLCLYSL